MTRILVVGDPHEKLDFIDKLTGYIETENSKGKERISHYITLGDYIEGGNAATFFQQMAQSLIQEVGVTKDDKEKLGEIFEQSIEETRQEFGSIYDQFAQRHRIIKEAGVEVVELLGNHDIDVALQRLENIVDNDYIKIGNHDAYCTFGGGVGMVDTIPGMPEQLMIPYFRDGRMERYGISYKSFNQAVESNKDISEDELLKEVLSKSSQIQRINSANVRPEDVKFLFMHEPIGNVATNSHKQHRANQLSDYNFELDYLARRHNWIAIGGHTHHSVVTKKDGYLSIVAGDKMAYDITIDNNGGIENIQPIRYSK